MAKKTSKLVDSTWQRVRTGIMAVSLLKPDIDQVTQSRSNKKPVSVKASQANPWVELRAKVEEQIAETQTQIEKLTKNVGDSAQTLTNQAQIAAATTLRKAGKRVWWATGLTLGFSVAGLVTYLVVRRRMAGKVAEETLIPLPDANSNGHHSPEDHLRNAVAQVTRHTAVSGTSNATTATATQAAPFIGNSRTMIYHLATSANLPSVEHRMYFQTEAEAIADGYRAAEGE